MAGRWIVAGVVVLVVAAAGAAFAVLTRDDDTGGSALPSTATTAPTRVSLPATTGAPPTNTSPALSTIPAPITSQPPPSTSPGPCGAETPAIRAALDAGVDGASERADMDSCRLAAVDASWAAVRLIARPGADFAPLAVLLQGGGGSWTIVDTGTADVGCGKAPQQVLVDLGVVCTSGGGTA